eukprot:10466381-Lingulodinium_polyedra.AAC.1
MHRLKLRVGAAETSVSAAREVLASAEAELAAAQDAVDKAEKTCNDALHTAAPTARTTLQG